VFHQAAFALMTMAVVGTGVYDVRYKLRPALEKRNPAECDQIMKQMWRFALAGNLLFLFGFFLWNMDNIFCRHLKSARNQILLPWSVVLEGHGWWHIFTGLGEQSPFLLDLYQLTDMLQAGITSLPGDYGFTGAWMDMRRTSSSNGPLS
jgi:hypothetical protein